MTEFPNNLMAALTDRLTRRHSMGLLAAVGLGNLVGAETSQARKRKGKKGKPLCRCPAPTTLREPAVVQTPFTVEARWQAATSDHDTFLFVPNAQGANLLGPFINQDCGSANTNDGQLYPFAFVTLGAQDETTVLRQLLPGLYEYWIRVEAEVPAGDLEVRVLDTNGATVQSWSSPANPSALLRFWHVFDLHGLTGAIIPVDAPLAANVDVGHPVRTDVCPT